AYSSPSGEVDPTSPLAGGWFTHCRLPLTASWIEESPGSGADVTSAGAAAIGAIFLVVLTRRQETR
ncbi:MAG: hypothetical protein ACR2Q4_16155, partial [Geminicoccaceae bacterium]